MKKKIKYALLVTLLLVGVYFVLRNMFGLFTPYNSWTARQDIKNGKVQIAEIGELPLHFKERNNLANKYGFSFYYFGCDVSKAEINGTKYYNNKVKDYLKNKYGADFWTNFQSQLDSADKQTHQTDKQ